MGQGSFFLIIGIVILANFFLLFTRNKKNRSAENKVKEERITTVRKHEQLKRRLVSEQENAARHVDLRRKTHELYEQVRRQAEPTGDEDDEDDTDDMKE